MSSKTATRRKDERLDAVFHALADTTRRRIVAQLVCGPSSVGDLAAPFSISLAAISKHIDVLEDAGVVTRARDGRFQRCHLEPRALDEASSFIEHYRSFWTDTLDGLAEYFEGANASSTGARLVSRPKGTRPPVRPSRSRRTRGSR
jgi:DNA-binding transcriptional ArsR family regulator